MPTTNSLAPYIEEPEAEQADFSVSEGKKPLAVGRLKRSFFLLERLIAVQKGGKEKHGLGLVESHDGKDFSGKVHRVSIRNEKNLVEDISRCTDFRIFSYGDEPVLTYVRQSGKSSVLAYAFSRSLQNWAVKGVIKDAVSAGVLALAPGRKAGKSAEKAIPNVIYYGHERLFAAISDSMKEWKKVEPHRTPHWDFFMGQPFDVAGAASIGDETAVFFQAELKTDLFIDVGLSNQKVGEHRFLKLGAALFSQADPTRLLWHSELPLVELPLGMPGEFSIIGIVPRLEEEAASKAGKARAGKVSLGKLSKGKTALASSHVARFYGVSASGGLGFFDFDLAELSDHRNRVYRLLEKPRQNPIVQPTSLGWEADGAFNPTAFALGEKIYLLYRAVGSDGHSRIGYAASDDGIHFTERLSKPVYGSMSSAKLHENKKPSSRDLHMFHSGGSWGGCEDPKAAIIDDRIYMTYVAHAGYWPMRTALTSIAVQDFLKKKWKWTKPMLMSAPNVGSKSVIILPEKINGNFYIYHRHWPNIVVDKVPDLEFGEGKRWLGSQALIRPRASFWDSQKISMGASPIKTPHGWLAIYNAVDRRDSSRYKVGAMLLSLDDPSKVIARCRKPLLSPDEWYENDGKSGVAYPGGLVEKDGMLYVYYGGGDKVSCVATIRTDDLVKQLLKDAEPKVSVSKIHFS